MRILTIVNLRLWTELSTNTEVILPHIRHEISVAHTNVFNPHRGIPNTGVTHSCHDLVNTNLIEGSGLEVGGGCLK